ncbi:MAG: nitroreductase family protein [Phycisphaeraceae bacterium]|nr:nitroreductase family protein [Phycisphaeraceae bacterium]
MDTLQAIYERRAVKHYDPDHELTPEEETTLLEAAIQSPTSFNMQNWRFVLVKDKALRQRVREAAWDQAHITESSLLIVLCADLKAYGDNPSKYWVNAPKEIGERLAGMMVPFYEGKDRLIRDEAMRSVGIAGQTIMLTAKAMGYDSCPMIGFDQDKVAELINLPDDHVIGFVVVVGKRVSDPYTKPGQLALEEVVVTDCFA